MKRLLLFLALFCLVNFTVSQTVATGHVFAEIIESVNFNIDTNLVIDSNCARDSLIILQTIKNKIKSERLFFVTVNPISSVSNLVNDKPEIRDSLYLKTNKVLITFVYN